MKIILLVIAIAAVYFVVTYNSLVALIEAIRNNQRQIDIQLDRRFKVFQSLINVVKKYMDYEKSTLKEVVQLRNQAELAHNQGDLEGRVKAEEQISKIASNIRVVFEQYPDLKANQNALQLQEEIVSTENKLSYSKQAYNDSIERYNARKNAFFTSMVVRVFPTKLEQDFSYWRLEEQIAKQREDYTVNLDDENKE